MILNTSGVERKVIGVGKDSLALILPREWIFDQKIRKGSKVLLFPQNKGQLIIQKHSTLHTKVTLDRGVCEGELLDSAILSSYLLNIDEIIINYPDPAENCSNINHLTDLSQKFVGMSLASPGPTQIMIRNLSDVTKLRITDIFNQMLEILLVLLEDIERRDFARNYTYQILQMENNYRMGVRLLIFIIRNQYLKFETGMSNIIQVLGYRIALQTLRMIILQVINIIPFLKGVDLPNLQVCFKCLRDLTQNAVRNLYVSDFSSIKIINKSKHDLEEQVSKIEDSTGILTNFLGSYFDLLTTLKEVAITRCVENIEVTNEEKEYDQFNLAEM